MDLEENALAEDEEQIVGLSLGYEEKEKDEEQEDGEKGST